MRSRTRPFLIAMLVLSLAFAVPAFAGSVGTEQQHGGRILTQLQHGTLDPKALTNQQYEYLGEYLMGRALGSSRLHQRMNSLMDESGPGMMGYGYGTPAANSGGGWPADAIVAVTVLAVLLIVGTAAFAIQKVGGGTDPGAPATR